jgi:hypothetical protein
MRAPVPDKGGEFVSFEEEERRQLNRNGQIQRSAAQWNEIIARYRQSGMGSRQFCEAEGLTLRTFEKWYGRVRRNETSKGKVLAAPSGVSAREPWAVEVEFPTGVRRRVRG